MLIWRDPRRMDRSGDARLGTRLEPFDRLVRWLGVIIELGRAARADRDEGVLMHDRRDSPLESLLACDLRISGWRY